MNHDPSKNLTYHTSILNFLPLLILSVTMCALTAYSCVNWPWSIQWVSWSEYNIPIPFFGLPTIAVMVGLICHLYNEKLILTPEYVIFIQGIFSWKQDSVRMDYASIKEVSIEENLLQRILGLGDLQCTTPASSQEDRQLATMRGLRNPRKVKDIIRERIHAANYTASDVD